MSYVYVSFDYTNFKNFFSVSTTKYIILVSPYA